MIKKSLLLFTTLTLSKCATSQTSKKLIDGMYLQWGYNAETYTRSTIHFKMSNGDRFTLHSVSAHDATDFDAIYENPTEVSIPQYNYRIGFYLNNRKSKALEINFDHAKYVVRDYQTVRVTGEIDKKSVDGDSVLNPATFLHLEHTDGANWLHINYVEQRDLVNKKNNGRKLLTWVWKAGAGINIPRTDFTWRGERLNNQFHIAGYNISAESGFRLYPFSHFFIEGTGKAGFVHYLNALANTPSSKGNSANHYFGYAEVIGTFGFDINF